jgi:hypothetical protein
MGSSRTGYSYRWRDILIGGHRSSSDVERPRCGRADEHIQRKAERVDIDMAPAARNLPARIEAPGVKRRAPF